MSKKKFTNVQTETIHPLQVEACNVLHARLNYELRVINNRLVELDRKRIDVDKEIERLSYEQQLTMKLIQFVSDQIQ